MYVQIIEFERHGLTRGEYEAFCQDTVPVIAQVPGVVAKLFLADTESSRCAGIYTFTDRESAEAYLDMSSARTGPKSAPFKTGARVVGDLSRTPVDEQQACRLALAARLLLSESATASCAR
jgi:hypothetical protein